MIRERVTVLAALACVVGLGCTGAPVATDLPRRSQLRAPVAAADTDEPSTSVSCGAANRGGLAFGARFPDRGDGFATPSPWRDRPYRYGTDEVVAVIKRVAARVAREHDGSILGVADLSRDRGGAIPNHRSHQSGRDIDLHYYAVDDDGTAVPPDRNLPYYGRYGRAISDRNQPGLRFAPRHFDVARNWALVRALLEDPVEIDAIIVSLRIRRWLLAHAFEVGAPQDLIERAKLVLRVPRNVRSHNDHVHVRVSCTNEDIRIGLCRPNLAGRPPHGVKWRWGIRCPR